MIFEYIVLMYNELERRTERKYGVVSGEDTETAMANLGKWYGDTLIRIEYFGTISEIIDDCVYEFNDEYADKFNISGRKFGKIIPPLNNIPDKEIYE